MASLFGSLFEEEETEDTIQPTQTIEPTETLQPKTNILSDLFEGEEEEVTEPTVTEPTAKSITEELEITEPKVPAIREDAESQLKKHGLLEKKKSLRSDDLESVRKYSEKFEIDPNRMLGLIGSESQFRNIRTGVRNPETGKRASSAAGYFQVVKKTGNDIIKKAVEDGDFPRRTKFNPYNRDQNIYIGIRLFNENKEGLGGSDKLAAIAHVAGIGDTKKLIKKVGRANAEAGKFTEIPSTERDPKTVAKEAKRALFNIEKFLGGEVDESAPKISEKRTKKDNFFSSLFEDEPGTPPTQEKLEEEASKEFDAPATMDFRAYSMGHRTIYPTETDSNVQILKSLGVGTNRLITGVLHAVGTATRKIEAEELTPEGEAKTKELLERQYTHPAVFFHEFQKIRKEHVIEWDKYDVNQKLEKSEPNFIENWAGWMSELDDEWEKDLAKVNIMEGSLAERGAALTNTVFQQAPLIAATWGLNALTPVVSAGFLMTVEGGSFTEHGKMFGNQLRAAAAQEGPIDPKELEMILDLQHEWESVALPYGILSGTAEWGGNTLAFGMGKIGKLTGKARQKAIDKMVGTLTKQLPKMKKMMDSKSFGHVKDAIDFLAGAGTEMGEEVTQSLLSNIFAAVAIKNVREKYGEKAFAESFEPDSLLEAGINGFLVSLVTKGVVSGTGKMMAQNRAVEPPTPVEKVVEGTETKTEKMEDTMNALPEANTMLDNAIKQTETLAREVDVTDIRSQTITVEEGQVPVIPEGFEPTSGGFINADGTRSVNIRPTDEILMEKDPRQLLHRRQNEVLSIEEEMAEIEDTNSLEYRQLELDKQTKIEEVQQLEDMVTAEDVGRQEQEELATVDEGAVEAKGEIIQTEQTPIQNEQGETEAITVKPTDTEEIPDAPLIQNRGVQILNNPENQPVNIRERGGWTSYTDQTTGVIFVDLDIAEQGFKDKAWTKPKREGVTALPEDIFNTEKEWFDFIHAHEYGHVDFRSNLPKNDATLENTMNHVALIRIGKREEANKIFGELPAAENLKPAEGFKNDEYDSVRTGKLPPGEEIEAGPIPEPKFPAEPKPVAEPKPAKSLDVPPKGEESIERLNYLEGLEVLGKTLQFEEQNELNGLRRLQRKGELKDIQEPVKKEPEEPEAKLPTTEELKALESKDEDLKMLDGMSRAEKEDMLAKATEDESPTRLQQLVKEGSERELIESELEEMERLIDKFGGFIKSQPFKKKAKRFLPGYKWPKEIPRKIEKKIRPGEAKVKKVGGRDVTEKEGVEIEGEITPKIEREKEETPKQKLRKLRAERKGLTKPEEIAKIDELIEEAKQEIEVEKQPADLLNEDSSQTRERKLRAKALKEQEKVKEAKTKAEQKAANKLKAERDRTKDIVKKVKGPFKEAAEKAVTDMSKRIHRTINGHPQDSDLDTKDIDKLSGITKEIESLLEQKKSPETEAKLKAKKKEAVDIWRNQNPGQASIEDSRIDELPYGPVTKVQKTYYQYNGPKLIKDLKKFFDTKKKQAVRLVGKDWWRIIGRANKIRAASDINVKEIALNTTQAERNALTFLVEESRGKKGTVEQNQKAILDSMQSAIDSKATQTRVREKLEATKKEMEAIFADPKRRQKIYSMAEKIISHYKSMWNLIERNTDNLEAHEIEYYITHIWGRKPNAKDLTPEEIEEVMGHAITGPESEKAGKIKTRKELSDFARTIKNTELKKNIRAFLRTDKSRNPGAIKKFLVENRFLKPRYIDTYLAGISKGKVPATFDVTEIMNIYNEMTVQVMANQNLIKMLNGANEKGVRLILDRTDETDQLGYIPIENLDIKTEALNGMSAHPAAIPMLNAMLKDRWRHPAIKTIEWLNGFAKRGNLSFGLFHYLALVETAMGTINLNAKNLKSSKDAYKEIILLAKTTMHGGYDVMKKKWDLASEFLEHTGELGDIKDVHRDQMEKFLTLLEKGFGWVGSKAGGKAGKLVFKSPISLLKGVNTLNDRLLWDYTHNTLKLFGYENLRDSALARFEKKNKRPPTAEEEELIKFEVATQVNDTFGGQNYLAHMSHPNVLQIGRGLLLSLDWTVSTARQFFSQIYGMGTLTKTPLGRQVRGAMGRKFWIKSVAFYGIGLNLLNMAFRQSSDEDEWEEKIQRLSERIENERLKVQLLKKERNLSQRIKDQETSRRNNKILELENRLKDLRNNKPKFDLTDPKRFVELSFAGNSPGSKWNLYTGKDRQGREVYRGFGKQFKEVPGYIFNLKSPKNTSFLPRFNPAEVPMNFAKRVGTKSSPVIQGLSELATGHSAGGYPNHTLLQARKKGGWSAINHTILQMAAVPAPFSMSRLFQKGQDFKPLDVVASKRAGMSKTRLKEGVMFEYTKLLKNKQKNNGVPTPAAVKRWKKKSEQFRLAAIRNNILPDQIFETAARHATEEVKEVGKKWETRYRFFKGKKARSEKEEVEMQNIEEELINIKYWADNADVYREYMDEIMAEESEDISVINDPYEDME